MTTAEMATIPSATIARMVPIMNAATSNAMTTDAMSTATKTIFRRRKRGRGRNGPGLPSPPGDPLDMTVISNGDMPHYTARYAETPRSHGTVLRQDTLMYLMNKHSATFTCLRG